MTTKYVHSLIFRPIEPVFTILWDVLQYATGVQQQCCTLQLHWVLEISGHFNLPQNIIKLHVFTKFQLNQPELMILLSMQQYAAVCEST